MTTEQPPTMPGRADDSVPRGAGPDAVVDRAPGTGWVRFGGVVMAVVGGFAVIEGLVALLTPVYFVATGGAVLALTVGGWGWVHLILGVLVLAVGLSLLGDAPPGWARNTAVVLVAINMLVQLVWLPAYPIWSIILLALDVFVLHALIVTWHDRRP